MNKQNAISKINKMGKVGRIISIIALVLASVAAALLLIALTVILILPKDLVSVSTVSQIEADINLESIEALNSTDHSNLIDAANNLNGELTLDGVSAKISEVAINNDVLKVSTEAVISNFTISRLIPLLVSAVFYMIFAIILCIFCKKLCTAVEKCESPFDEKIIAGLRKVAFSLIPLAVLNSLTDAFALALKTSGNFDLSVNPVAIIMILIIFALAYIFKYGAVLQKESDETL